MAHIVWSKPHFMSGSSRLTTFDAQWCDDDSNTRVHLLAVSAHWDQGAPETFDVTTTLTYWNYGVMTQIQFRLEPPFTRSVIQQKLRACVRAFKSGLPLHQAFQMLGCPQPVRAVHISVG